MDQTNSTKKTAVDQWRVFDESHVRAPLKRALNDISYEVLKVLKHLNSSNKALEAFRCTVLVYEF